MSRYYKMSLSIRGHNEKREEDIKFAAEEHWEFENWGTYKEATTNQMVLLASGEGDLSGGMEEDEFVNEISRAIWIANGGFCKVQVTSTCLENLPEDCYELTDKDYKKWKENN